MRESYVPRAFAIVETIVSIVGHRLTERLFTVVHQVSGVYRLILVGLPELDCGLLCTRSRPNSPGLTCRVRSRIRRALIEPSPAGDDSQCALGLLPLWVCFRRILPGFFDKFGTTVLGRVFCAMITTLLYRRTPPRQGVTAFVPSTNPPSKMPRSTLLTCLAWPAVFCLAFVACPVRAQSPAPIPVPEGLSTPLPEAKSASTTARHLSQTDQANIILKRALLGAVWGQPVHCKIHQEITAAGQTIRGTGIYARGGLGEMKLVLQAVAGNSQNRLEQVSDGRRLRVVLRINGEEEGYHVDLTRIHKYLGGFTQEDFSDPNVALHLAIGGQNEKLRGLCQLYEWTSVRATTYRQPESSEDTPVWELTGVRNLKGVLKGTAPIDGSLVASDDAKIAPDAVKITVARGGALPFWLYAVEETRTQPSNLVGKRLAMRIEYYDPVIAKMPPGTFSAEDFASSAGSDIDETIKYQPPVPVN